MEIKVVDDVLQQEAPKEESFDHGALEGNISLEISEKAIGQVLGLETPEQRTKYQDNIRTLLEYAKNNSTDQTPEGLKWAIRSLELRLGTPPFAEDRVKYVTRYAYLLNEEKRLTKERRKFERNI